MKYGDKYEKIMVARLHAVGDIVCLPPDGKS